VSGLHPVSARDLNYRYDYSRLDCFDEREFTGRNPDSFMECGELQKIDGRRRDKILRELKASRSLPKLSGLKATQVNLSKMDLSQSQSLSLNLDRVNLSEASFQGADLRSSIFLGSQIMNASFKAADLRGVQFLQSSGWESADFREAIFDDRTRLPFSCSEALGKGMKWRGLSLLCQGESLELLNLSAEFQTRHPYVRVLHEKNLNQIIVLTTDNFRVHPIYQRAENFDAFGLSETHLKQVLCATKIKTCLKKPSAVFAGYELKQLPIPVVTDGIEIYHGDSENLQDFGLMRAIGYFEIVQDLAEDKPALEKDLETELKTKEIASASVVFRPWVDLMKDIQVSFDFLPEDAKASRSTCELIRVKGESEDSIHQRIFCRISFDVVAPADKGRDWLDQWRQAAIRRALSQTLSIRTRPFEAFSTALSGGVQMSFPIGNLNFKSLVWGEDYRTRSVVGGTE